MDYLTEINNLREREKELHCIYNTDEILSNLNANADEVIKKLVFSIPNGFQFPGICSARIIIQNKQFVSSNFQISNNQLCESIIAGEEIVGKIEVYYSEQKYCFLPEEQKLVKAICNRLGIFLLHNHLHKILQQENELDSSNWKWKKDFAKKLADYTNFIEFEIEAIYLIGSVKNATAKPASDIDLIIQITNSKPKNELIAWLKAWSICLAEINYEKTGIMVKDGLLDVHYINNESFRALDSFAVMIDNMDNSAVLLKKK
ncbi:MAG: hypothetical protein JXR58_11215 [Bacteroidales bacterium]|nr:hypothetical protein [Bacteroidales bacterium]